MSIPYRTRRVLNTFGTVLLILMLAAILAWLCWVVWLQRYVVYEDGSARLDFSRSANEIVGEVARPSSSGSTIEIYYNEGADAINTTQELTMLNGYYITYDMCKKDMDNVMLQVERLAAGTPVMLELKLPYGYFLYSSKLEEAITSPNTDLKAMDALIEKLMSKGFYTIARINAVQDWNFVNSHPNVGLKQAASRAYCWLDNDGFFCMDPTNASTQTWLSSIVMELRDKGFHEVLLGNFNFPNSDKYYFDGDKETALQEAAAKLLLTCEASNFTLSFEVENPAFSLPQGRSRIYLKNVTATALATKLSQVALEDPEIRTVFLSETGDTRYDDYGVLRILSVSEEVEARK